MFAKINMSAVLTLVPVAWVQLREAAAIEVEVFELYALHGISIYESPSAFDQARSVRSSDLV